MGPTGPMGIPNIISSLVQCKPKLNVIVTAELDGVYVDERERGACPQGFVQVNNESCYYALSDALDWWQAAEACTDLNSNAFSVAINSEREQRAVEAVSSLLGQFYLPERRFDISRLQDGADRR